MINKSGKFCKNSELEFSELKIMLYDFAYFLCSNAKVAAPIS